MNASDYINLGTAVATSVATAGTCWVAYLTIGIARATRDSARATRDQMHAALRPYIQVSVAPRTGVNFLELSIVNSGQSSALNLRLTVDQPFQFNGHADPGSNIQGWFGNLIESLPPGTRLVFPLGTGFGVLGNPARCPRRFSVQAKYFHQGEEFIETTVIDLGAFAHSSVPVDPIAEELKELRKQVERTGAALDRRIATMLSNEGTRVSRQECVRKGVRPGQTPRKISTASTLRTRRKQLCSLRAPTFGEQ